MRVTRFYQSDAWGGHPHPPPHPPSPPPPPRLSSSSPPPPVSPRPCLHQLPPLLQLQIAVGTAGPHVRAPDPSG